MKKVLSLILSVILIFSTLLFAVSCGETDGEPLADGSTADKDTSGNSSGGNLGASNPPVFLPGESGTTDPSDIKMTSRALLSSVRVVAHFERYLGYGQTSLSKTKKESAGVIYRLDREAGDAYIITNFQAVYLKDAVSPSHISDHIEIFLYGQESESYSIRATYVGGSLSGEVAVLRVSGSEVIKHSHATAVTPTNSNGLRIFDGVFAIGNPKGRGLSATSGIVSVENDSISILAADGKTTILLRTVRTNAVFGDEENPSGGLFDRNGNLVGILVSGKSGDNIDNMSYAIPSNLVVGIADILIENQTSSVSVGYKKYQLGISMAASASGVTVDEVTGAVIKTEQIEITAVQDGSPLEGFANIGDIITSVSVDGRKVNVTALHIVIEAMLSARLGSTVEITLQRGGETLTKTVKITENMLTAVA